jgi:Protein of unknown function (DUF2922)
MEPTLLDRKLYLVFNTDLNKTHTIVVDTPLESYEDGMVQTAMDAISVGPVLTGPNGTVVSNKEAYIITRRIEKIDVQ